MDAYGTCKTGSRAAAGRAFLAGTLALALALAALAALAVRPAAADTHAKPAATLTEKGKIEEIIRNYLHDNPEVVIEAIESWRAKQRAAEEEKAKQALVADRAQIFASAASAPRSAAAGSPPAARIRLPAKPSLSSSKANRMCSGLNC